MTQEAHTMEHDSIVQSIKDLGTQINVRLDKMEAKIDLLSSSHAELDKQAALVAQEVGGLKESAKNQGERIGALESDMLLLKGRTEEKKEAKQTTTNWSGIVISAIIAITAIVVSILLST
jgi:chromosome segregation ATPase